MNELTASKLQKLQEQRELSDKLNNVLTKEGGLIQRAPASSRCSLGSLGSGARGATADGLFVICG